jgi:uncharacterized protein with PQ loop repeat
VVLQIVRGFPQLFQLFKTRRVEGLSVSTWSLLLFTGSCWWWWGFTQGQTLTAVANGVSALTAFIILLFIAIERRTATSRGLLLAFGFFAAVVAYSETKPGALPLIAIAGAIFCFGPQVVSIFRSDDHSGISLTTWTLAVVNSAAWTVYGAMVGSSTILLPGFVSLPLALAIIGRVALTRRRDAQADLDEGSDQPDLVEV